MAKIKPLRLALPQREDHSIADCITDEALMASLRDGKREVIGCLFQRYARTIYSVGERILRDAAEADDLVQEVFLYLFRKSSLYDPSKGSARSWLLQVAYTQAFMRRRKLKALGFYENNQNENCESQSPAIDCDCTPKVLIGHNRWKSILQDLTSDQEQVLRLHFFEGYTFAEIAEKLGQSYANVRNHHYRGLDKLRKHLTRGESNRR